MGNISRSERAYDWLARLLCLVISAVFAAVAFAIHGTETPALAFWILAAIAALFAFAGIFGPKGLRHGLLAGFPPL